MSTLETSFLFVTGTRFSTVLTASNWQVRKPVYTSAVGRWKNYEGLLGDG